jgi:hypothetical protein
VVGFFVRWSLVLASVLISIPVWGADANRAHPHGGLIPAYRGEPPPISLSPSEKARLISGKVVEKTLDQGNTGTGIAVFVVDAPAWFLWSILRDVDRHHLLIDNCKISEVYARQGDEIFARFVVGTWGMDFEYFVRHKFPTDADYATWTLDYRRESDLTDTVGFWRIRPLEGAPHRSVVEYTSHARMEGWIPGFLRNIATERVISDGALWLKRAAERDWRKRKDRLAKDKARQEEKEKATQRPPFPQ